MLLRNPTPSQCLGRRSAGCTTVQSLSPCEPSIWVHHLTRCMGPMAFPLGDAHTVHHHAVQTQPSRSRAVCHSSITAGPSGMDAPSGAPRPQWLSQAELAGYAAMARLHNLAPSLALVLLGAWAGGGRRLEVLALPTVWAMAAVSAGVTIASMLINDYFDWASGADSVNAPHKPLPAGLILPDRAVLAAAAVYMTVLIVACCIPSPTLRAITAFSAGATLLYTPVFKRITAVKNACVAAVIAAAPLSGALAAGAGAVELQRLAAPTVFSFTAICFREVLMDVADMEGDKAAGVVTLPVLLGAPMALAAAVGAMVCGAGIGIAGLLNTCACTVGVGSSVAAAAPTSLLALFSAMTMPQAASVVLVVLALGQLLSQVHAVYASNFDHAAISAAVSDCMKPIAIAFIILAATA